MVEIVSCVDSLIAQLERFHSESPHVMVAHDHSTANCSIAYWSEVVVPRGVLAVESPQGRA